MPIQALYKRRVSASVLNQSRYIVHNVDWVGPFVAWRRKLQLAFQVPDRSPMAYPQSSLHSRQPSYRFYKVKAFGLAQERRDELTFERFRECHIELVCCVVVSCIDN